MISSVIREKANRKLASNTYPKMHLHPFHENWPHQIGHNSDGCRKCFAIFIHDRVTQSQIRDTLPHRVNEQQGLAGWYWRRSKNLPPKLTFWHSSPVFQKPDGTAGCKAALETSRETVLAYPYLPMSTFNLPAALALTLKGS